MHRRVAEVLAAALLTLVLAACGGGGGGSSGGGEGGSSQAWGTAELIEFRNTDSADFVQIAIDASGNGIAVWHQNDGMASSIWANRYSAASGTWGVARVIETDNTFPGGAFHPQIAFDTGGNALAVWTQSASGGMSIWANRFSAASGAWGTPQLIDPNSPFDSQIATPAAQIAFDASGNAIAVWFQSDGTRSNIRASRFSAASGTWGAVQLVETDNAGNALLPQIAFDASGNAIAVWQQSDGTRFNIWANRFSAASGTWGAAQLIETDNSGNAFLPQIAFDTSGNAIAVWEQSDGTRFNIWANRFSAATGTWGIAQLIENNNAGDASFPKIAIDASGNAIGVWHQSGGTQFGVWANRFSAVTGIWGMAQLISSATDDLFDPRIALSAFDAGGNAIAVWSQIDGMRLSIWASRFSAASSTWGMAQVIETDNSGEAFVPDIALNANGNALAVWQVFQNTIGSSIWANRFQ